MHGEVGVNVPQENDDDVAMPNVAIDDADEEPGVNMEPMATINDVFRNTLADDTEDDDGLPQMPHDVQGRFLSVRQLNKLEIMRKDRKTSLYPGCPMSKLQADIMQTDKLGNNPI